MKIYGTLKEVVAAWFRTSSGETVKLTVPSNPTADNVEYQLPDVATNDVLVSNNSSSTFTNKTFDADGTGNSITNIENADIKTGAAIARNKLASGTASHVIINDGSGVFSSEAQLATSRGGTGVNSTATFPSSGVIVTEAGSSTLSNKTQLTPVIDDYFDLNEESAPSTPASGKVRVYAKTDNKLYLKDDLGTETAVGSGGSGEINAITTGSTDATGWTGGTTDTSNSPLSPVTTTSIAIANSATTESSTSGGYKTFTLPTGLQNKKLKVEFYFTTPATDVYRVSVYKSTTRVPLSTDSSSVTTLPASTTGKFTAYFDTDTTSGWTVSITRTSGSTGTCYVTSMIVGPGIQPQGAVVGDWISYTPTTGAMGTSPTVTGLYRRVGDSMEINFRVTLGTSPGAGTKTFDLPSGFTIDFAKLTTASARSGGIYPNTVGSGAYYAVSTENVYPANIQVNSDDSNTFYFAGNGNGSNWSSGNTPVTPAANDRISAFVTVPIAEWPSGTVNLAQNDVEYAYNTTTSDTDNYTAFGYGPNGTTFPGALTTGRDRRVRFQSPIQPGDQIVVELSEDRVKWIPANGGFIGSVRNVAPWSGTTGLGYRVATINSTDVDIYFSRYTDGTTDWTTSGGYWRVRKSSAGAAVGFGIVVPGTSSGLVSASGLPGRTDGGIVASGYVGQQIRSTLVLSSATSLTTVTPKTVVSIALTAGEWDVSAMLGVATNASTTVGYVIASVSTSTNSTPTSDTVAVADSNGQIRCQTFYNGATTATTFTKEISPYRVSLSGSTTLYLVAEVSFGVSTCSAYGSLRAVRVA